MAIEIKWCGLDFGQCIMDPSGLRNYLVIGDVCKILGEPEYIHLRIHRYHAMKEKYGSYAAIKEGHRDKILSYVFDHNEKALELFSRKEQEHLKVAKGLREALIYLRDQGIFVSVVAELKKTLGPMGADIISQFLKTNNLVEYFHDIITPQGKINLCDGSVDTRYRGKTKEEGTLYDVLLEDLTLQGIEASQAVMVGDKDYTDIRPAKERGFRTIQYIGYINYGRTFADFVISDFRELKGILLKAP
jgi:FMN phosphatase YigB (HAD superfamily)